MPQGIPTQRRTVDDAMKIFRQTRRDAQENLDRITSSVIDKLSQPVLTDIEVATRRLRRIAET